MLLSPGAIEINQRSTCSKTDAVGYIGKNQGTIQKSKFDKIVRKLKSLGEIRKMGFAQK
jgi:hypothetical protein